MLLAGRDAEGGAVVRADDADAARDRLQARASSRTSRRSASRQNGATRGHHGRGRGAVGARARAAARARARARARALRPPPSRDALAPFSPPSLPAPLPLLQAELPRLAHRRGTDLTPNWGNRDGFIGRNARARARAPSRARSTVADESEPPPPLFSLSQQSTVMNVTGARAVPVPETINIFQPTQEYPATGDGAGGRHEGVDDDEPRRGRAGTKAEPPLRPSSLSGRRRAPKIEPRSTS